MNLSEKEIKNLLETFKEGVHALNKLGLNSADTGMGALELIAKEIHELLNEPVILKVDNDYGEVLMHCAERIKQGLDNISDSIEELAEVTKNNEG